MKHISKTILAALAIGLLSCGLFSQQAQAVGPQGEIHMAGDVILSPVTQPLSLATTIAQFIAADPAHTLGAASTFGATGDFAVVPAGTLATMSHPWTFSPSAPVAGLWAINAFGFSFDLAQVTQVTHIGDNFLNVLARGTVHSTINPIGDSPALFSFTVTNPDGLTHGTYSFANATITIVPDGGTTVMLLGAALGLLGIARRALKR